MDLSLSHVVLDIDQQNKSHVEIDLTHTDSSNSVFVTQASRILGVDQQTVPSINSR